MQDSFRACWVHPDKCRVSSSICN